MRDKHAAGVLRSWAAEARVSLLRDRRHEPAEAGIHFPAWGQGLSSHNAHRESKTSSVRRPSRVLSEPGTGKRRMWEGTQGRPLDTADGLRLAGAARRAVPLARAGTDCVTTVE